MRGRKPKPAALRRLEGNPSKRPIVELTVMPAELPPPPRELKDRAAAHWQRNAHLLNDAKLLTRLDADTLADYCEALEKRERLNEVIAKAGDFVSDQNGVPKAHPAWSIIFKLEAAIRWFQSEYGMTASARMRVKAGGKDDEKPKNPFEEFMKGTETA